ncbi:MAG TPA: 30S ribosomal protein S2 [Candidatus Nitrosocosmicus sp.]|nr:30S ribosomal protein S2 [Candidatus Nitrosocosmicus sp.]
MKKSNPEELMQHGLHFGHKSQRVNPRAHKYIFKIENGISIIDLFKTAEELDKAKQYLFDLGKQNKNILVVATKKQAKSIVSQICKENGVNYLTSKWIGGFISNFEEIKKNIKKLETMRKDKEEGGWNKFPKHERFKLEKQLQRVNKIYEGVANLTSLPDDLLIIDIKQEANAVKEAKEKGMTIVAVVDTNSDPYLVDYPIPANDDAITSIEYLTRTMIEAYTDGKKLAGDKEEK